MARKDGKYYHHDPLDEFTHAYLHAALWSTKVDGEPLDKNYMIGSIHPTTFAKMKADCEKFQKEQGHWFTREHCLNCSTTPVARAGHDFWLTRNGAVFCDGDWTKEAGDALTKASKAFGEVWLYVGDDGNIHSKLIGAVPQT